MLDLFLELFLIKMAIKVEKGDFMKMSVSCTQNTHFARSGACFWGSKSMKKQFKKRNGFWKAFLTDFDFILELILKAKGSKNRYQN